MNEELKIHDIKNIIEIPDNSFLIFIILCLIGFIVVVSLIFFIIKLFKNKKQNLRKIYFENLKNIDYKDSKKAAYNITVYLRFLAQNETEKNYSIALIEELEKYKYKKDVEEFDEELKAKIETFKDMIDV